MALLDRSAWYDLARTTEWTPTYISADDLFPPEMSGGEGIPDEAWSTYDEPYKVSYREYVDVQRQKDAGAYSVKAALERNDLYNKADAGWISILKEHYAAVALVEYGAALQESRFVRWSKAPGMRNMATFGMLDEMRHGQIQLYFPHEYISKDRQFDWSHRTMWTNNWVALGARHYFDDIMMTRDAVATSIYANFAFETGFTNLQFIGLSGDAANAGDFTFSKLIQSIQSDEARHAQLGTPLLQMLIEHGQVEKAQNHIDVSFWRSYRLFTILSGIPMDYYVPLDVRESSFKEFMQEWIVTQFIKSIEDLGLRKPWYWDIFMRDLDEHHHGQHLGTYSWRPTLWWHPAAGVSPEERDWLEEKYPGWNDTFGKVWDVMIDNFAHGRNEKTIPGTLPITCNVSQLPIVGTPGRSLHDTTLVHEGRKYHFASEVDKWIFQQDPERYKHHRSLIDRFLGGEIQPANLDGVLEYMGLGVVSEGGEDAHNYAWVDRYRDSLVQAG
ncbi:YHS domain-containing protein [Nocardia africana]|uniref:propane 2-monooxygenase n=1 Tax=Nocardia africana TaxID=134964 RepID=A0A378WQ76_9NOCA|nr:YHS domain-containing protein [Nocardia africana]MCC3314950.1 YHS domain-containing protein [Nocardia africana]SUA42765.1 Toluene-4-monooxygenase system protein A [Nocardia africana]